MNEDFVPYEYTQQTVQQKLPLEMTVKTSDFIQAQGLLIFAALILATIAMVDLISMFVPEEND